MKIIYILLYVILIFLSWYYITNKYDKLSDLLDKQILSWSNIFLPDNGKNTVEPDNHTPIEPIEKDKTEYQKFTELLNNSFVRKFNPPNQPAFQSNLPSSEKSDILNAYLKKNNSYFRSTSQLTEWYLYIKLTKPIWNYDIFLYFHDSILDWYPVSWKIIKQKNLINSNQEFLFKLNQIWIYKFFDGKQLAFNWINSSLKYTDKIHFIGWYTTSSDWNSIQEIIITGK